MNNQETRTKKRGVAPGRVEVRMHLLEDVQKYIHDQAKQLGMSPADFVHLLCREHQHKSYLRLSSLGYKPGSSRT
jgi:hypothetical protein